MVPLFHIARKQSSRGRMDGARFTKFLLFLVFTVAVTPSNENTSKRPSDPLSHSTSTCYLINSVKYSQNFCFQLPNGRYHLSFNHEHHPRYNSAALLILQTLELESLSNSASLSSSVFIIRISQFKYTGSDLPTPDICYRRHPTLCRW